MSEIFTVDGTKVGVGDREDFDGRRRSGKIEAVSWDDDHGEPIAYLMIHFDRGGCQGFGGLALPPTLTARLLAAVAEVAGLGRPPWGAEVVKAGRPAVAALLVGSRVTALWPKGENNESIEGLDGPGGRLTLTGFRRACGFGDPGCLIREEESLRRELRRAEEKAARCRRELGALRSILVDWGEGTVF